MTISSFMDGKIQENYCGVQLKIRLLGDNIKVRQNGFAPLYADFLSLFYDGQFLLLTELFLHCTFSLLLPGKSVTLF